jgi:hypothetical protein
MMRHTLNTFYNIRTLNPAGALRNAARYLTEVGWTQGQFFTEQDTATIAACAVGALCVGVVGMPVDVFDPNDDTVSDLQVAAVLDAVDLLAGHVRRTGFVPKYESGEDVVTEWNDHRDRIVIEVINALLNTADEYDTTDPEVRS